MQSAQLSGRDKPIASQAEAILPKLYYSDTDSLYFEGPLPNDLVDATRLGALNLASGAWSMIKHYF